MKRYIIIGSLMILFLSSLILPTISITYSQTQPLITVTAVPPLYAIYLSFIGDGFVDVKNPMPPGVDPHTYEPTPEVISSAVNSDLVIVDVIGHLPIASKLIEAAKERGVKYLVIYDELIKRGWKPLNKSSGAPDIHIEFDLNATLLFIDIARDAITAILREKLSNDMARFMQISSSINASADTLKRIVENSYQYARSKVSGLEGVALYSIVSLYLVRSIGIDPVYTLLEEPDQEPTPGALVDLRNSNAKCILVLEGMEEYSDRVLSEIESMGVKPVIVNIRETMLAGAPYIAPVLVASALENSCTGSQSSEAGASQTLNIATYALLAYSIAVSIALIYIIYKRASMRR
ncbi:MAG: zinc ABC transporter substrate-binding protein [Sulfolobales archaeon]